MGVRDTAGVIEDQLGLLVSPLVAVLARLETIRGMVQQYRNTCANEITSFRDGQLQAIDECIEIVRDELGKAKKVNR
jgi:hypothetical protein